jgi:chromosome segregation ATPase
MTNICQYCETTFTNSTSLKNHIKTAKYCLELRGKINEEFKCEFCGKILSTKLRLSTHLESCNAKKNINFEYVKEIENKLVESEFLIKNYQEKLVEKNKQIDEKNKKIEKLEDTIIGIAESKHELNTNSESYETQIQELTIKYGGRKQRRQQIKEPNVIYILSTELLEKERRYIFGKSKNLTARLSTYNKSDEHKVIYYQPCGTESNMDIIEKLVLNKLERYREIENRDRFILPEDKEIEFFIDIIKKSISFILEN